MDKYIGTAVVITIIGVAIFVAGMVTMQDVPVIAAADFEVTSDHIVPANNTALLVPIGLGIALAGISLAMYYVTATDDPKKPERKDGESS